MGSEEQQLEFNKNVLKFMKGIHTTIDHLRNAVVLTNKRIDLVEKKRGE